MWSRMTTSVVFTALLVMTLGLGTAFAASDERLEELAAQWSAVYSDRSVYQCAEATGTGGTPDARFEAPHALGAVVLYAVGGEHAVYEDVQTGERLYAPDQDAIEYVVKVRWVGVGGGYLECIDSAPTTTQATSTTTQTEETTTTSTPETTTTTAAETTTTPPQETASTAVAPTTVTTEATSTTAPPEESSTTGVSPTTTEATTTTTADETTSTTVVSTTTASTPPPSLPVTGIETLAVALVGFVLLGGGVAVLAAGSRRPRSG